ncbi:MAG: adenylate/guanylate cyclase domain-containing protein [Chitinophagaceae bacterium]
MSFPKKYYFKYWLLLLSSLFAIVVAAQYPVAEKGVLDLRHHSFEEKTPLDLKGEWEFYWQQLFSDKPQLVGSEQKYITLPRLWNGFVWKGNPLKGDGYATFYLKLLLPVEKKLYSLDVPYMYSAYRIYIDSLLVAENGTVANTSAAHQSKFMPKQVNFQSQGGETGVFIQVSNFDDRKGGIWKVPQIGSPDKVIFFRTKRLALEFFLIGALIFIGLYQIGLSFIRKEDNSSFFFGLFCITMGVNSLFVGSIFIHYIFPGMSWHWVSRLEYISMYAMPVLFFLFINSLFPGYVRKIIPRIFVGLAIAASLFIVFTQKKIFGLLLEFLLVMVVLLAIFTFKIVIKAIKNNKYGSRNALLGIIIIVVFTLNDIFYGMELIHTGNYRQYGLLIFVVIQSLNIAYIFSEAFNDVKKLTQSLKLTNTSMSRFVPEAFLRFLGKQDILSVQLGDQKKADMTILFVDIRSFTTLSEKLSPKDNFHFINSYLSKVSPVIRRYDGFVDKYIGDAIMALFPQKPDDAILAAQGILTELQKYNETRMLENLAPVKVGMGLHTGSVMLGTVGEEERMDTTVISDTVNLAARLEGLAKIFDLQTVTTLNTIEGLHEKDNFAYRIIHKGKVKGKHEAVTLVEVFNVDTDPLYQQKIKTSKFYADAMGLYQLGKINDALQLFSDVVKELPNDKPALYYIKLCQRYLEKDLPENWNGIESLDVRSVEF